MFKKRVWAAFDVAIAGGIGFLDELILETRFMQLKTRFDLCFAATPLIYIPPFAGQWPKFQSRSRSGLWLWMADV